VSKEAPGKGTGIGDGSSALTPPVENTQSRDAERMHVADVSNDARLAGFLTQVGSAEPLDLAALREAASEAMERLEPPPMACGVQLGRLLHMLVRFAKVRRVLQVGCSTVYAAAWMALALPPDGRMLTLESDEGAAEVALRHLGASGIGSRVEVITCDTASLVASKQVPTESPVELAVWHCCDDRSPQLQQAERRQLLAGLLDSLSPRGVLVMLHPPVEHAVAAPLAGSSDTFLTEIASDDSLRIVTIPAPDGDGGLVSFVSLSNSGTTPYTA
jgi:hypothetical protein